MYYIQARVACHIFLDVIIEIPLQKLRRVPGNVCQCTELATVMPLFVLGLLVS